MWKLHILVTLICSLTSANEFEASDFDATQALRSFGVNVDNPQSQATLYEHCSCADACAILSSHYGPSYVLTPNGTSYTTFREAYWSSIQTDVYPQCVFSPPSAEAVAVLVLVSRITQCPFAVKSGGHSAFAGAASIQGGITVSLQNLNEISLSADGKIAYVQPGNDWVHVYAKLAEKELTAIGGRISRIGVGGLTLGGGISFFSGLHGWACDNVGAYEVVTASGTIVNATVTNNSDLYWALRGGGNNFGIVTRFHYRTLPIPGNIVWGGTRTYLEPDFDAVTDAFVSLTHNSPSDPRAGYWAAFVSANGTKACAATLWYSDPSGINHTTIFDGFNSIKAIADSTRPQNLVQFVTDNEASNPYGFREAYWTFSTKISAEIVKFALTEYYNDLPTIASIPGIGPALLFQSITVPQMISMAQNGGNPLGLDPKDGPLFIIAMPTWWTRAEDDHKVYTFISNLQRKVTEKAKEMGLQSDYLYMNYASQYQDVIRGYGAANGQRLIQIGKKYDPHGVFQTLQPGYFKLTGPPVPSDYFSGTWSS